MLYQLQQTNGIVFTKGFILSVILEVLEASLTIHVNMC